MTLPPETSAALPADHPVETLSGLSELADAFQSMRTTDEVTRFLRDLCTLPELEALVHRWQTARLVVAVRDAVEGFEFGVRSL